ncbi:MULTISPECIES: 50S ribosomal protein L10 [unclassified Lentimicrobium]|uniref:50S ribosomal protein L10 n=1 Tax=unclassified Lentimicrobium TaxID=2677434 RepID=UPI001554DE53|nr:MULTISPECIES: 50S ribosomal protein L10 [unclassified Lentimicrobium]NPD44812.1 50S ribosomal protein L10 [Lentimicrobium sp. S6]NPD83171.1 50S ribosomal protein L10 [Lentimicrobium sp. L6]
MRKENKNQLIASLKATIDEYAHLYVTDIAGLNAEDTSKLRRESFKKEVKLVVAKNTLLKLAMDESDKNFDDIYEVLKGNSSIMFSNVGNAPAKLIKGFRKKGSIPMLKGAYVEESVYIGDDQLDVLANIKSKEELIGDIVMLLQSPAKNVISALQSGGNTIAGLVKTLSERPE